MNLIRGYILTLRLIITKRRELVEKKEFVAIGFDLNDKIFIVYIVFFASSNLDIDVHLFCKAQIVLLIANKTLTSILSNFGICYSCVIYTHYCMT